MKDDGEPKIPAIVEVAIEKPKRDRSRDRRRERPRSKSIPLKRITREELRIGRLMYPPVEGAERPKTRAECKDGPRPCPWVSCKHHLYLDINPGTGSIKLNFPDLEPWELQHTCSLDVADDGAITLEDVGAITNLTRERVRQLEVRGLLQMQRTVGARGISAEDAAFVKPAGFEHPDAGTTADERIARGHMQRRRNRRRK